MPVSGSAPRAFLQVLALAVLALAFSEVGVAAALSSMGRTPGPTVPWLLVGVLRTVLAGLLLLPLLRAAGPMPKDRSARLPLRPAGPAAPAAARAALAGALFGLLALFGSLGVGRILAWLGHPPAEQETVLTLVEKIRAQGSAGPAAAFVGVTVLLAPWAEEWFFRGLLFGHLAATGRRRSAYGASALLFALVHGNLSGLAVYTWLGLCFAWAYARTGRLWVAALAHGVNNAAVVALLLSGHAPAPP